MEELRLLVDDLFNLKFKSNTFADKGHENSIKGILVKHSLSEINKDEWKKSKNNVIFDLLKDRSNSTKFVESLKDQKLFIEQPFGSQKAPDFIFCINGFIIWLECKSSEGGKLVWNTGYPKSNILFLYSDKKKDTTTLFLGQFSEIIENNPLFESEYESFDKAIKELASTRFKTGFNSSNFSFYARRMLNDNTKYSDPKVRIEFFEKTKNFLGI